MRTSKKVLTWVGILVLALGSFASAATYDWKQADKVDKYAEALRGMKPGITEIVLHCTELTDVFPIISSSSLTRKADLDAMLDARLKQVIEEEGIILTTWRELKKRRDAVGKADG